MVQRRKTAIRRMRYCAAMTQETAAARSGLTLYCLESGATTKALGDAHPELMHADFADIRTLRFYTQLPADFFAQYAGTALFENADRVPDFAAAASAWLQDHPGSSITAAAYCGRSQVHRYANECTAHGIDFLPVAVPAPRTLTLPETDHLADSTLTLPALEWPDAALRAGMPAGALGSVSKGWETFFREELLPDLWDALAVKKRSLFYDFLVTLARALGEPLNFSALASACGLSAPGVRAWVEGLEARGVIDLVPGLVVPRPRRTLMRPRIFFTQPGLAAWLVDPTAAVAADFSGVLRANLLYLAVKDARPQADFFHFLDTNKVCVPLISVAADRREAWFLNGWAGWPERESASASLARIWPLTQTWQADWAAASKNTL